MCWLTPDSVSPQNIITGFGSIKPKLATDDHMTLVERAKEGEYLDVHAWVFTPPSFLLVMAQLASDGFLPFRLYQFYPTNLKSTDRDSLSFVVILENIKNEISNNEIRLSYLNSLGED